MKGLKVLGMSFLLVIGSMSFANVKEAASAEKVLQGPEWERLGSRVVNMTADHDEIPVTAYEGTFTKVKLKIRKAPIFLHNINIIFGNGDNKNVVFNRHFAAGSETRVIDLPGNKRIIKKVNLNYKSAPTQKGRAVVSLWGKH